MSTLSASYGRKLDGVLGYSFLTDKIVLIDYGHRTLGILDRPGDATPSLRQCRERWSVALRCIHRRQHSVDPEFPLRRGHGAHQPRYWFEWRHCALSRSARSCRVSRAALAEKGEASFTGARGKGKSKVYVLGVPVGFGPFHTAAGHDRELCAAARARPNTHLAKLATNSSRR